MKIARYLIQKTKMIIPLFIIEILLLERIYKEEQGKIEDSQAQSILHTLAPKEKSESR